jgi:UDP-2,3-diacylglucosamine hydrolase
MTVDLTVDSGPIYFISDAHLGIPDGPPDRERWLLELLAEVPERAAALFVLGDLFDFWFEYRHAIPKGTFHIARAFANALDAGVPVVYLGGNHDFWVGSYLRDEVGVRVFDRPIDARLQGRLIHLAHGDGLGPGDNGYKVLKSVLRHPLAIRGYRAIHPDLGIPLAHRVSSFSRGGHTAPREILLPRLVRDIARPRIRGETTGMVMGHIHYPVHYEEEGRDFLLIGDWLESFTHVRMEDGRFTLYRRDGGRHVPVDSEPFPPDPDR